MSQDEREKWRLHLEGLARALEPEAMAKGDLIFDQFAAEHERQTAGYHFECRRWGDFLTVFMERPARDEGADCQKVSTSINIGKASAIKLVEGRCFDRRGVLTYHPNLVSDSGNSTGWGTGYGECDPGKGWHYRVWANYPSAPRMRPLVETKPEKGGHFYSDNQLAYVTENYPRHAEDDRIVFEGIDTTVFAPAGMGRQVFEAIMTEIERGTPPTKLPKRQAA